PVVVALHLEVEDLGLGGAGGGDEVGVEQGQDAVADAGELGLDLAPVGADGGGVGVVPAALLLLLDRRDDPPRRAAGADDVLVRHGQQVPLLHRELLPAGGAPRRARHALHVLHHLLVPLRLLRQLRLVHALLPRRLRRRHG
ncbi:Os11g0546750, partial [Oryza sativa Japonica Group]